MQREFDMTISRTREVAYLEMTENRKKIVVFTLLVFLALC